MDKKTGQRHSFSFCKRHSRGWLDEVAVWLKERTIVNNKVIEILKNTSKSLEEPQGPQEEKKNENISRPWKRPRTFMEKYGVKRYIY